MHAQPSLMSRYKWPLILAVLLLILVPLQVLLVLSTYSNTPGHAFVTPGEASFDITDTGKYTLWITNQETVNGQLVKYPQDVPSGMAFALTRDADQAEIPLLPAMTKTVTIGQKKRKGHLTADIQQPGRYTITTTGSSENRVLYFAKDFVFKMVSTILCTACSSIILFIAMIATAVYALVKRPMVAMTPRSASPVEGLSEPERLK